MKIPSTLKNLKFCRIKKGTKKPFEKDWTNKPYSYDEISEFKDENYGVLGGGEKKLVIVDFDDPKIQEEIIKKLPKTFTVKTGSGLLHKYYYSNDCKSFKIFNKEMGTLVDVQGEGKQVVGANSIHPNGKIYEVVDESEIGFINYFELKAIIYPYDKKPKKEIKKESNIPKDLNFKSNFLDLVKERISFESLLSDFGVDTSKNPTNCLFHSSKGGKCLGWNNETAHCFHCDDSWNLFSLVMKFKNLNFKDGLDWIADKYNLQDELKKSRDEWKEENEKKGVRKVSRLFTKRGQVEELNKLIPFFYDNSCIWWLWNEESHCWKLTDETDILNMIEDTTGEDTITSKNKTEILNAMKQRGRRNIPKPMEKTWIQFQDEVIDFITGKRFKATPEYFVVNPIPHKLNKNNFESTPTMDRIFEEWVGKDYVKTLYEIIAYCLLPYYPIHRLFCFIGSGLNGKSKFLELLRNFIGKENCCSTELDTLMTSRFEITRLHKKLVCQMGETNFNEISRTSMLKKLTGDDLLGLEYKNKNPFEDKNYAKVLIATNNLPTTSDKTIGFYRRWLIIDFPNQFSEKKDILEEIPEEEYESLALKSLIILKDLLEKRMFHKEGSIEQRMEKYETKSEFLQKFLNEFTEQNVEGYISKADFHKKFTDWCIENRHRKMSENSLGRMMNKYGVEGEKKYVDWLYGGKGGQMRVWVGMKWKE